MTKKPESSSESDSDSDSKDSSSLAKLLREIDSLNSIFKNSSTMLAYFDKDFKFIKANPAYIKSCGFKEKDLIGKNHFDLFPNKENEKIFKKAKRTGRSLSFCAKPFRFKNKPWRGITYWDWTVTPVKDKPKKVKGLVLSLHDVTERVRVRELLIESQLKYKSLISSAIDAVITIDNKGIVVSWNKAAERIFGYKEKEMIGKNLVLLMPRRHRKRHREGLKRASILNKSFLAGRTHRVEGRKRDGSEFSMELSISSWEIAGKLFYTGIIRDITEKKRMEDNVKQQNDLLQAIVDNSASAIYAKDKEGRCILFNKKCEKDAGLKRTEVLGRTFCEVFSSKTAGMFRAHDKKIMKIKKTFQFEENIQTKNKPHVNLVVKFPIFDSFRNLLGVGAISTDITEIKELEHRKDDFINMASHELKTPLTSVKVYNQLLQKMFAKDKTTGKYLLQMERQINNLSQIVNDLLDVTNIQRGRLSFKKNKISIARLTQESVELAKLTTDKHKIFVEKKDDAIIFADKERINQVFANLLSNAIKYSPKSDKIIIRIEPNATMVKVSVKDFGVGISSRYREKIFNRFFRVYKTTDKTFPGLGMGLYISYEIIKRHRGKMWVESEKGKGATFYFTLPILQ